MKQRLFAAAFVFILCSAFVSSASASPVVIFSAPHQYANGGVNPCVFTGNGNNGCGQVSIPFPDPVTSTQQFATNPLVNDIGDVTGEIGQFAAGIGWDFFLGLDVNQGGDVQTLTNVTITFRDGPGGTVLGTGYQLGGTPLAIPVTTQGEGFTDYVLSAGCLNPVGGGSGVAATCTDYKPFTAPLGTRDITFTYGMGTFNDGAERLFLVADGGGVPGVITPFDVNPVPEPASMVLLGSGSARRRSICEASSEALGLSPSKEPASSPAGGAGRFLEISVSGQLMSVDGGCHMRKVLGFLGAIFLMAQVASASTILQFSEAGGFNTPFVFAENAAHTATTITASKTVSVTFDHSVCLVLGCGGVLDGNYLLSLNATSSGPASLSGGAITEAFGGTISITNGAVNLLTVNFTDLLQGSNGGNAPTLQASQPPDMFVGSSTVLDPLKLGLPRGFSLSFSNLGGGGLAILGSSIRSGNADATGTFSAEATVPEPASMMLLGSGLAFMGKYVRRRRRSVQ